ncbi:MULTISPECIES: N-acetylmuramate alpha-1-phosphate uridylyltransferase MurU [Psychrobacter]|jgi:MurNAc alpha-1-phosphate uridylyltransferase|uniref:N-acetylmuramate alpha-1-phosphate uridylyltransferase MurU n=1 Tax=Psychrobacter TaxID=497 RepID=UPI001BAE83FA|nr:nucleotidyltransferase family protein [Psychrobacter sp. UBA2514]|tara:strand:- start:6124 stop:6867 length:744 start_codon:yes stop_codon:yes gene_type:complete
MSNSTITQAMILAAGKGTRLRPLTLDTPKPLVEVGGQPLIVWHIKALKAAGITDITINASWLADKLMDTLGDGAQYGVKLHWSVEGDEPLETAGGIFQALQSGKLRDEPFILVNSDVWTTYDFAQLRDYTLGADQRAHLLLIDNPEHNDGGDFAINNGLASEQPVGDAVKFTFAGISVMSPTLVEGLVSGQPAALAPLLKQAMIKFQITAEVITDNWIDVGTAERLTQVNEFIEKNDIDNHQGRVNS